LTISNDLPFAQKRFCAAEGIDRVVVLSDYRGQKFGRATGLFAKETYLLARSVTVVDQKGVVRYTQIVPIQGQEPDYAPVLGAARALLR
jgi:thiol peroxidase